MYSVVASLCSSVSNVHWDGNRGFPVYRSKNVLNRERYADGSTFRKNKSGMLFVIQEKKMSA